MSLKEKIDQLFADFDALLVNQTGEIADLRAKVNKQLAEIQALQGSNDAQRARIESMSLDIERLLARIKELEEQGPTDPEDPEEPGEPTEMKVRPFSTDWPIDQQLTHFAHTGRRDWNYGGHNVPVPFDVNEGYWDFDGASDPWLFDRASSEYLNYELTGAPEALAEANACFKEYVEHIGADGYFDLKKGEKDTKYLYIRCFYLHLKHNENATLDQFRPMIDKMWQNLKAGYNPGRVIENVTTPGGWTERESWVHAEGAWYYWLLTNDVTALNHAVAIVEQFGDGINLVPYTVHEGGLPGGAKEDFKDPYLSSSTWMSALYFETTRGMVGRVSAEVDKLILEQVANYCEFLLEPFEGIRAGKPVKGFKGFSWGEEYHVNQKGILAPRYMVMLHSSGNIIGDAVSEQDDQMHTLGVMGLLHFGKYALNELGRDASQVEWALVELEKTAMNNFTYYTRTSSKALPKYRIKPARFWLLWSRGRSAILE